MYNLMQSKPLSCSRSADIQWPIS